jgi:hypothetical protein
MSRTTLASLLATLVLPSWLGSQAPVIRDSAGITIVENGPRASAPRTLTLGAPFLRIGEPGSDVGKSLSRDGFHGVTRLSDGRIVVNDNVVEMDGQRPVFTPFVKYFSPEGELLTLVSFAESTEPVRYITSMCRLPGDTIIGNDTNGRGIVALHPDGSFAWRVAAPTEYRLTGGCLSTGAMLAQQVTDPRTMRTDPDPHVEYYLIGSDLRVRQGLGFHPYRRFLPIAHDTRVMASGDRIVVADSRKAEYRVLDAAGKVVRIVRWGDPLRPVTDADFESGIEKFNVAFPMGSQPKMPVRDSLTPSHWPSFGDARLDEAGRVWLMDGRESGSRSWTIFAPDGRLVARFTPPEQVDGMRWRPSTFGRDELVAEVGQAEPFVMYLYFYKLDGLN